MPAPLIIHDIELGTIRLLSSFPEHVRDLFEHLIAIEDMRCIMRGGHAYVAWDDVAAAFERQGRSDDAVLRAKARLTAVTSHNPQTTPATPFAHALKWRAFWSDAAFVAANLAGEVEAATIQAAFTQMSESIANGAVNSIGTRVFHRTLLSLADANLVMHFDEIWLPGAGRLDLPNDAEKQRLALAFLERLTAMFNGGRGAPEGADTPRRAMDQYLSIASLVPGT
jgi:hypothetical protein